MNKITVVLLNWKRPANVEKLIDALTSQTEQPTIYLWDNNVQASISSTSLAKVDWYVCSSNNRQCVPRWWMAQQAKTPYIMSFDDDIIPSDNYLLSDLVQEMDKELGQFTIISAFGKVLIPSLTYEGCPAATPGEDCDIALGRVMAMRTQSLRTALNWECLSSHGFGSTDDIAISAMMRQNGLLKHKCSKVFEGRLTELPDDYALCKESGHFERREAARRQFWF